MSAERDALLDRTAVADIVVRERIARDNHDWATMAACYHDDSLIETTWFRGTGQQFVAASRRTAEARPDNLNFHVLGPMAVTVVGDRAIGEMPCTLRSFGRIGGAEASIEGFTRLLWRARRAGERWLIAGLRAIYVRDLILACDPGRPPRLDPALLDAFRPSYRYLSYHLQEMGLTPSDDLPGIDRPETVRALHDAERRWLAEA